MTAVWLADICLPATSSWKINTLLMMAAVLAAISLWFSSPPSWVYLMLMPLFALNSYLFLGRTKRADALLLAADGTFRVSIDGLWFDAELHPNAFVAPWLMLLRSHTSSGCRCYFCWLPVLADTDMARKVRVVLRWRVSSSDKHSSRAPTL